MLTGCTVPPRMSRRLASPEAVTRSYSPSLPVIRVTISSDVAAVLTDTLQPVSASNWVTQS
jgi:hypothetical protein